MLLSKLCVAIVGETLTRGADIGCYQFFPRLYVAIAKLRVVAGAIGTSDMPEIDVQDESTNDIADDTVLSTGDWTAFDLEMVAPPSGNSLTAAVGLAEQTGESNGAPTANDSKLTGSVTGNLPQIVIEFDHDGNGTVDGTSHTELDGKFTYKPGSLGYGR